MPIAPEEHQSWKDRHAATSIHMMEVHERWGAQRPLDPEVAAAYDRDYAALVHEFKQFKEMPDEVWDELLATDGPEELA